MPLIYHDISKHGSTVHSKRTNNAHFDWRLQNSQFKIVKKSNTCLVFNCYCIVMWVQYPSSLHTTNIHNIQYNKSLFNLKSIADEHNRSVNVSLEISNSNHHLIASHHLHHLVCVSSLTERVLTFTPLYGLHNNKEVVVCEVSLALEHCVVCFGFDGTNKFDWNYWIFLRPTKPEL